MVQVLCFGYIIPFHSPPPLFDADSPPELYPIVHPGYRSCGCSEGFTFQGCHGTLFILSGLLQSPFRNTKGHWWLASGYRLVIPQPVCAPVPFSYGDSTVSTPIPPIWRLADFSQPPGRIPPSACPPAVSEVSVPLYQLPGVSILGPMLWFVIRASCLHACHGPGLLHHALFWLPHSSVFGRLAGPWLLPIGDHSGEGLPSSTLCRPRHSNQLSQELSSTCPALGLSRDDPPVTPLRAFPTQARIHKVLCLVDEFSSSPEQPLSLWRSLLGVMSSLSTLIPGSRIQMQSLQHRLLVSSSASLRRRWSLETPLAGGIFSGGPFHPISAWVSTSPYHARILYSTPTYPTRVGAPRSAPIICQAGGLAMFLYIQSTTASFLRSSWPFVVSFPCCGGRQCVYSQTTRWHCPISARKGALALPPSTRWLRRLSVYARHQIFVCSPSLSLVASTSWPTLCRRDQVLGSEWTLHQEVCRGLFHLWPVTVDLFTTSLHHRFQVYFSPMADPQAAAVDALVQSWDNLQAYAFPPFGLLQRVLSKVRGSHNLELTLIAPFWPLRSWFADLLELLVEVPVLLPLRCDLLRQPHFHHFHGNLRSLGLTGYRIASDPRAILASLQEWLVNLPSPGALSLD